MNGDHTWLNLKTPDGKIYSTGLYRQGKKEWFDNIKIPLRVKKGYYMSPDMSEFWPGPIQRIPVEITKDDFDVIKKSIEEDKVNEEECVFQIFNGNCTEWVNSKAALIGIKLPTSIHYLRNITPIPLQKVGEVIINCLPDIVLKICMFVVTFFTNLLQVCLGAFLVDNEVKEKGISVKCHISSFWDMFNQEKLYFHPPRHLGLDIKKEIEEWREKNNDPYGLPDEYWPKGALRHGEKT